MLGVSPDSVRDLKKFAREVRLPFTLLADPDHVVADTLRSVGGEVDVRAHLLGQLRSTFIIDPAGVVRHVIPKVTPKTHDDDVLAAIAALR